MHSAGNNFVPLYTTQLAKIKNLTTSSAGKMHITEVVFYTAGRKVHCWDNGGGQFGIFSQTLICSMDLVVP